MFIFLFAKVNANIVRLYLIPGAKNQNKVIMLILS